MMNDLDKRLLFLTLQQWESTLNHEHENVSAVSLMRLRDELALQLSFRPAPQKVEA